MTDSTSTTSHDDFVASLIADRDAFDAEQERLAAEAEAKKSIVRGALTQSLFSANLDIDDLHKVIGFIQGGCEAEEIIIVNGDDTSEELEELKAKLAKLERGNAELRKENERLSHLDDDLILAFKDKDEFRKAQAILTTCTNGGGKLIDPRRVVSALKPKEQQKDEKGPSGPPTTPAPAQSDKSEKKSVKDRILGK